MSYKQFRSELAKQMKKLHDERLEQLEKLDSLLISEKLKEEARKQIFNEFTKKIEEISERPWYLEAKEAHIAENRKQFLQKKYEKAIKDVMIKEKIFEDAANVMEKKKTGWNPEKSFEIPKFRARGRGNSDEDLGKVMLILDSLSDDDLNEMAHEFYEKGWILLLLKNQKFTVLQKKFFAWAEKNEKELKITFDEWKKMLRSRDYTLIPKVEKELLIPFSSFLEELFFEKMEKVQDKEESKKYQLVESEKEKNEWEIQNEEMTHVVPQPIIQPEEQIPREDDSEVIRESGEKLESWEKSIEQEWWDDEQEIEQSKNIVVKVDEASENGEFVEVKIGEYSVKIMKSKHRLSDGACFGEVKQCIEDKIKKMGIEYDSKKIKNLPSMIFNKVKSIVYNDINVKERDFYLEGISNLIKNNEIIIDVVLGVINSQTASIQTNKKKGKSGKNLKKVEDEDYLTLSQEDISTIKEYSDGLGEIAEKNLDGDLLKDIEFKKYVDLHPEKLGWELATLEKIGYIDKDSIGKLPRHRRDAVDWIKKIIEKLNLGIEDDIILEKKDQIRETNFRFSDVEEKVVKIINEIIEIQNWKNEKKYNEALRRKKIQLMEVFNQEKNEKLAAGEIEEQIRNSLNIYVKGASSTFIKNPQYKKNEKTLISGLLERINSDKGIADDERFAKIIKNVDIIRWIYIRKVFESPSFSNQNKFQFLKYVNDSQYSKKRFVWRQWNNRPKLWVSGEWTFKNWWPENVEEIFREIWFDVEKKAKEWKPGSSIESLSLNWENLDIKPNVSNIDELKDYVGHNIWDFLKNWLDDRENPQELETESLINDFNDFCDGLMEKLKKEWININMEEINHYISGENLSIYRLKEILCLVTMDSFYKEIDSIDDWTLDDTDKRQLLDDEKIKKVFKSMLELLWCEEKYIKEIDGLNEKFSEALSSYIEYCARSKIINFEENAPSAVNEKNGELDFSLIKAWILRKAIENRDSIKTVLECLWFIFDYVGEIPIPSTDESQVAGFKGTIKSIIQEYRLNKIWCFAIGENKNQLKSIWIYVRNQGDNKFTVWRKTDVCRFDGIVENGGLYVIKKYFSDPTHGKNWHDRHEAYLDE